MKELFNHKPGSLKDTLSEIESIPSIQTWSGMEAQLHALNKRKQRKRNRRILFVSLPSLAAIFVLLFLTIDPAIREYQPRKYGHALTQFQVELDPLFATGTNSSDFQSNQSGQTVETRQNRTSSLPQTPVSTTGIHQNSATTISSPVETVINPIKIHLSPKLALVEPPLVEIAVDKNSESAKFSKWRIEFHTGSDFSQNARVTRSSRSPFGNTTSPLSHMWAFEPYQHNVPVSAYVGVQRILSKNLSITAGVDYKYLSATANSVPHHNDIAIKSSKIRHAGISLGARLDIRKRGPIYPFIAAEIIGSHVSNMKTTVTEYNAGVPVAVNSYEDLTSSTFMSATGIAGLNIVLSPRISIQMAGVANMPIFNYFSDLNVYNNGDKYIPGLRAGLTVSL